MRTLLALFLLCVGTVFAQSTPSPAASDQSAQTASAQPPAPPENGPEQPIAFSHKIHAGTGQLPCETCHTLSRSGESLTIPQAKTCMQCHQAIATDKPGVQKLAGYAKDNRIIPWVRVYEVPSFVSFSHKVHLDHGNTCVECHGAVAERTSLSKETDISMAGCMGCHKAKNAATGCSTCHQLDQSTLGVPGAWQAEPGSEHRGPESSATGFRGPGEGRSLRRFLTTFGSVPEAQLWRAHQVGMGSDSGEGNPIFSTLGD